MIRVLIAEDQGMVLGALAALLTLEPDLQVVGCAADGQVAREQALRLRPDVLVADIEMPGLDGLSLAAQLRRELPGLKVVILTTFARSGYLRRALEAGVQGYLLKDAPSAELAAAIRRAHLGERVIAPDLAVAAWCEPDPLTPKERELLQLAATGLRSAQIAAALHLSEGTVRNYLSAIIAKLGASNRLEAVRRAQEKGWL